MARQDYIEIKSTFEKFLDCWKRGDVDALDECVLSETACFLSTVKAYPCGSQHSIYGVKDFILDTPKPDIFHITNCNFVARVLENIAKQSAIAVCRVGKFYGDEDIKTYEFAAQFSNSWQKTEKGWRISEIRMDIADASGDYIDFIENWHMEPNKSGWSLGVHLPVISGELDNPWTCIPNSESELTDEEQILESMARYTFGIDTCSFMNLPEALSEDLIVNMAPWGAMDRREFMQSLKISRQTARYWSHPCKVESIEIKGNQATARLYRMLGHKQRNHPLVLTKDNVNIEHACARYEVEAKKENGIWKISKINYFLGIIDIGNYED